MTLARPTLLWRGHVVVTGVYFDATWSSEAVVAHVSACWRDGDRLFALPAGTLWRWGLARRRDVGLLRGHALVQTEGGTLAGGPTLTADEKSVVVWDGGAPLAFPEADWRPLALDEIIDVSTFERPRLTPLSAPPALPVAWGGEASALGGTHAGTPTQAQRELLTALKQDAAGEATLSDEARATLGVRPARWLDRALWRLFGKPPGQLTMPAPTTAPASGRRGSSAGASGGSPLPSGEKRSNVEESFPWARAPGWRDAWRRWIAQSWIGRYLARRHAEYLAEMLRAFEQGKLDEGLRRAIPIDGRPGGGPATPALSPPTPRDTLDFTTSPRRGVSQAIGLPPDLIDQLRQHYRKAAEDLVAAGRVEDAAFVYIELLQDRAQGLRLLEQEERFELAAQIAEAGDEPPEQVIRLWFLAGNRERAIMLARRHDEFFGAIERLKSGHPEAAQALLFTWADNRASKGDYLGAVQLLRHLTDAGQLVRHWISLGIQRGEPIASHMRLQAMRIGSATEDDVRAIAEVFASRDPAEAGTRLALARAMNETHMEQGSVALANATVLSLLRDQHLAHFSSEREVALARLARHVDPVLHADLPPPTHASRRGQASNGRLAIPWSPAASIPVLDAVMLPNRRVLVALGERGCALLRPDGGIITRWDQPVHALVATADLETLLGVRGFADHAQVYRINTRTRTLRPWARLPIKAWASWSDGDTWLVAERGQRLTAYDLAGAEPTRLWRGPDVHPGRIVAVHASAHAVVAEVKDDAHEAWVYERRRLRLSQRYVLWGGELMSVAIRADGSRGAVGAPTVDPGRTFELSHRERVEVQLPDPGGVSDPTERAPRRIAGGRWVAIARTYADRVEVSLLRWGDTTPERVWRQITLADARLRRLRFVGPHLIAVDARGRVHVVDVPESVVVQTTALRGT